MKIRVTVELTFEVWAGDVDVAGAGQAMRQIIENGKYLFGNYALAQPAIVRVVGARDVTPLPKDLDE